MKERKIITVEGINAIAEVGECIDGFWVTIASLGSTGLFIDNNEWSAFVKLINETDKATKEFK